jgi:uncharacterized protein (TIGR02996 family)
MPPDETSLLAAVRATPRADGPRLVYADFLDDRGRTDQAGFIRDQIELAKLAADSPRRRELADRCRRRLDAHAADWLGPAASLLTDYRFARGFLDAAEITAENLARDPAAVFAHPVRRLWVTGLGADPAPLAALPAGHPVTTLDLTGNDLDAAGLRTLARLPAVRPVRSLWLLFNRLDDAAAEVLATDRGFLRLARLRVGANPFTPSGRDRLRAAFGRRVSFARARDPGQLYTLAPPRFAAGVTADRTQAVFVAGPRAVYLALFDHAGNLLRRKRRAIRGVAAGYWRARQELAEEMVERWQAAVGFEPAAVRVRRFRLAPDVGLFDYPAYWCDAFDDPAHPDADGARLWRDAFLGTGRFTFRLADADHWLDRTGQPADA